MPLLLLWVGIPVLLVGGGSGVVPLMAMVRELQPNIIVDNRLDLPKEMADIVTPEQYQPASWPHVDGEPMVWEACQTFSGS